jgi:hypothetical protein
MEKLISAKKALVKFEEILADPAKDEKTRDAAIQRFEFTSEACWKLLQAVCYDAAFQVGLIDEELCLELNRSVKDRNLTSHTYHEGLAEQIYQNLPGYASAFQRLLASVS